jgi:ligand-binding sensor domain-containing protein
MSFAYALICRSFLVGCLTLASLQPLAARPPRYAVPSQEAPVALLAVGRATYLVTEQSVFRLEGQRFVRHYQSAAPITCALVADSGGLWLGTRQGLLRLGTQRGAGTWLARPLALPAPAGPAPITALLRDAAGTVWVGAGGYGAYQLVGQALQAQLHIPTINAGLATADSSVWLATNLGLHRWQHGAWTRYNEEGVANHEIPDNLVEKLLLDNGGSLWVLMSEGISVFENVNRPGAGEAHLPTVKYLGQPGNEVYSVAALPGQGHVFATAMGLLLLPTQPSGELAHFEATTDRVETPHVLRPVAVPGVPASSPRLLQVDARQRIWVVRPGEVSVWRAKDFRAAAPVAPSRGPGA